ncbi:hypothetical protein ES703_103881 [subsurface metagenome]
MAKAIRATKIQTLQFIRRKEIIEAAALVEEFGYSPKDAREKLRRLEQQKLVEKLGTRRGAYCLTVEAHRRLEYHDRRK